MSSEGGISRGEGTGAGGGPSNVNESLHEIPEPSRHELLLLLRVEQEDGRPLPVGTYTERCVNLQIVHWTGIHPIRSTRINPLDTVVEFAAEVPIVAVAQQLHMIREWEEVPVTVSCIMGRREYIMDVCRQKSMLIEQRGEAEREIEKTKTETRHQKETLSQLVDRVNQQARLIGELQTQSLQGSMTRIPSDQPSHHHHEERYKTTKTPDLPIFSGELPTPKGEVEFDNWIFQIKSLQKTFTDDAIRNAVVANARGIAKTVVRAVGYDTELSLMISHLEDRFGLGETNDMLLLEFHQMSQGVHEKVQDFGSKLECKFKILQERFPGRYAAVQLKDRFFSGLQDKMRDSMRFLYMQEDCTFSKLLKAAMIAEAESKPRVTAKVKAANADTNTNDNNPELSSIQSQLDSMSKILKGRNLTKMRNRMLKVVPRRVTTPNLLKLNLKTSPRDLLCPQQALSLGVGLQSNATGVWAGATSCATAQTRNQFKVALNGKTCMGRWLRRVHPFPRRRGTPKTHSNFQGHGGWGVWSKYGSRATVP